MKTVELDPGTGAGAIDATFLREATLTSRKTTATVAVTTSTLRAWEPKGAAVGIKEPFVIKIDIDLRTFTFARNTGGNLRPVGKLCVTFISYRGMGQAAKPLVKRPVPRFLEVLTPRSIAS